MLDPESDKFKTWTRLMATGHMVGKDRPISRVTWQKRSQRPVRSNRPGPWRHLLFQGPKEYDDHYMEVECTQTVQTIQISRSIGQDSATCTITMANIHETFTKPEGLDPAYREGYFTFNRGTTSQNPIGSIYEQYAREGEDPKVVYPTSWDFPTNLYRDVFIPNTVIRTYQGYGSDNLDDFGHPRNIHDYDGSPAPYSHLGNLVDYVSPWEDSKLQMTGVWLIDRVTLNGDGSMQLECRDMSKLLMEQFVYPPMIPLDRFPLIYCPAKAASGSKGGAGQAIGKFSGSSVDVWYGYNASLKGHRGTHAFDGRPDSYWLSVGNSAPNADYSFEWIQADCGGNEINEIIYSTVGSNYTVYVCVYENGSWQGATKTPYNPNSGPAFPNGSDQNYVMQVTSGSSGQNQTLKLPRTYKAKYVRLIFTNLWNSGIGPNVYRAAVREFVVRYNKPNTYVESTIGKPGYISDWSEAVKELCAWAGFTWVDTAPAPPDYLLGRELQTGKNLRVWGDFEVLGAGPVECTPGDFFLNKSFMEAVRTITDFLGCIFYVDETGGAIFRLPNVFSGGNFINDPTKQVTVDTSTNKPIGDAYMRRQWPIEFHENANLTQYSVVIDDSQVRSEILVVGDSPDVTTSNPVAAGYVIGTEDSGISSAINLVNVIAGQTRLFLVPGDATKGFKTEEECQRMAELIALYILFSYRKGTLSAPAHPGLQLDDQIRIFERVTNEVHVHYVSGIETSFNSLTGEYMMNVTCHWLGEDPDTDWFLDKTVLTPAVAQLPAIIARLGSTLPGTNPADADPNRK